MKKEETCHECKGTGKITRYGNDRHDKYACTSCNGKGTVSPPPIQAVDEAAETEDVNLLKRRLEFYRNETSKIRDYVFDDANKCGYPTQSIFEAITDKIDALKAEIAEHQARQQPVRKTLDRYDIDFGGNVMAGIEVEGQINIVGAMDGYGNGISLDKIIITPIAQAKAVEPQETPDAVELLKEYQSRLNEVYQNTGALTGIDVDYCLLLTLHDNGFKIETPTQTNS